MNHLLSIRDLSSADLEQILAFSEQPPTRILDNKGVALYFEKSSARTRNAMEMATAQLGGHPVYLQSSELGIGSRESVEDVTRTLACYHAIIAARVYDHCLLEKMAAVNTAPILNMLSETDHPLQALADLLTIRQLTGRLEGLRVAFVGEANNVARSLAEACALVGAKFVIASPEGYGFDEHGFNGCVSAAEAVAGTDIVYTDVWVSMGSNDSPARRSAFAEYTIDEELMALAPGAWFMHCLPAHRGEEVAAAVIDGPRSAVWRQAENRMHTSRGAMLWMLKD